MQPVDGTPTPAQILAAYTQAVGACPLITGRVIPHASEKMISMLNQALSEARQAQATAQKTAEELKRGVERAAEGVLGDEQKEMEFARAELEDLRTKPAC